MKYLGSLLAVALLAMPAAASHVDGSIAGDGYTLASLQTANTNFGDNQSELNAAWARSDSSFLYLTLTGNIQDNFNKLNIFIDSVAGGQNQIGPATDEGGLNPNNDDWAENYSGVGPSASGNGPGFTFDTGFEADYLIIVRRGGTQFDFDFNSVGNDSVVESSGNIFSGATTGSNASVGASGIGVGYDDSNTGGVGAGTGPANPVDAAAVQTGLELAIPLAAIGNPGIGDTVLISAHVNGSNHDFLSNQSLGGFVPPQDNLGGDGGGTFNNDVSLINLNQFQGLQYFAVTLVPEPTSMVLFGLGLVGLGCTRRRS